MAGHAPEDSKLSRAAAILFGTGFALLILAASVAGFLNRGAGRDAPMPPVLWPVVIAGVAACIGGLVALTLWIKRESNGLDSPKK